jgi:pimeloyl-ACP methyl ester carboxylesterase
MKLLGKILLGLLLLISVLGTAAYIHFNQETLELDRGFRDGSGATFIQLPQGVVHYQLAGPADAETVVLVHGFSVPSYIWDPTFAALVDQGYQVLRFDLFGRGWSDRPETDYSMALFADQLDGVVRALNIKQPFNLIGLSMGGPIVSLYSNQHPASVKRLVLEDPMVFAPGLDDIKPMNFPLIGEYLAAVYLLPRLAESQLSDFKNASLFPDWGQRFEEQMRYKGFRRAILSTIRQLAQTDTLAQYQRLGQGKVPIQVFWGRDDTTIPLAHSETLMRLLPAARLDVFDDAGHIPHLEKPEAFNALLFEFLKEI